MVPHWDLLVFLLSLTEKAHERWHLVLPRLPRLKVLFLHVTASAHWVLKLHALYIDPPFLIGNPLSYLLVLNPVFWPKMVTEGSCPGIELFKFFYPEPAASWSDGST